MSALAAPTAAAAAAAAAAGVAAALLACGGAPETDVARGQRVYRANCVICHALDPRQPGTIGPAIAGSSRPLLEARVLRASYPPGYTPQRDTQAMPPLPFLADEIPYLAAYLGEVSSEGARP
jgi:mono/diheme cytochrome c family protein